MQSISYVKPMHKRVVECTKENNENNETPAVKRRAKSGPQDSPRLSSQKLYTSLFELVPQACLFTIVDKPVLLNQTENEIPSLPLLLSSEQLTQQDDVQSDLVTSPIPLSYSHSTGSLRGRAPSQYSPLSGLA